MVYLSSNGKYVNLGDYYEISNNHDLKKRVDIDITLQQTENERYEYHTQWDANLQTRMPQLRVLKAKSNFYEISLLGKTKGYDFELKIDKEKYTKSDFMDFVNVLPKMALEFKVFER